jgi:type II secretory pathway component PulJ
MSRRGWTVGEVVVASTLAALLGVAMFRLLLSGSRLYARGQARSELMTVGMTTLGMLCRELREASAATVTWADAASGAVGGALSFRAPAGARDGPLQTYSASSQYSAYVWDREDRVLRRLSFPAQGADNRLAPAQLLEAVGRPAMSTRVVARGVEALDVTTGSHLVKISLTLRRAVTGRHALETTVSESVAMRNTL